MLSLENECARCALEITKEVNEHEKAARDLENRLRNALSILQEQGLYAFFLFIRYKHQGNVKTDDLEPEFDIDLETSWKHLITLFNKINLSNFSGTFQADETEVINLTNSLIKLRVIRFLITQTIIYALYGLRAIK